MNLNTSHQIQKALPADVERLALVSARAFEHDPLTNWLMDDPADALRMEMQMFRAEYRITARYDLIYTDSERMGVAIWKPPGAKFTLVDRFDQITSMFGTIELNRRAWAKIKLLLDIEKAHLKAPHYYLSLLAVAPEMQGKGLGTALIRPILNRCDQEGLPAYLETETESNVLFYQKRGFQVREEILTSDGRSKIWTMVRNPVTL